MRRIRAVRIASVRRLTERVGGAGDEQHGEVSIRLPLVGSVGGYAGWFRHRTEEDS